MADPVHKTTRAPYVWIAWIPEKERAAVERLASITRGNLVMRWVFRIWWGLFAALLLALTINTLLIPLSGGLAPWGARAVAQVAALMAFARSYPVFTSVGAAILSEGTRIAYLVNRDLEKDPRIPEPTPEQRAALTPAQRRFLKKALAVGGANIIGVKLALKSSGTGWTLEGNGIRVPVEISILELQHLARLEYLNFYVNPPAVAFNQVMLSVTRWRRVQRSVQERPDAEPEDR